MAKAVASSIGRWRVLDAYCNTPVTWLLSGDRSSERARTLSHDRIEARSRLLVAVLVRGSVQGGGLCPSHVAAFGVMVALVTGAAVGIGRAIALALLAEGMETWLADVQDPEGPEGRFVRVDVTDDVALRRLIVEAKPRVLVNNASVIPAGRSEVEILDLNLRSALVATKLALEHGARAIVNIASVAGIETTPHRSPPRRRGEGRADPLHDRVRRAGACELHRPRLDRHAPRAAGGSGDDRRRARSRRSDGRDRDDHRGRA
jgi:hypothetical protein